MLRAFLFAEESLTVDNVTKVMETVTAGGFLKVWKDLNFSKSLVNMVTGNLSTFKERTQACVDIFLNCEPRASWQRITTSLFDCKEIAAARKARIFCHKNGKCMSVVAIVNNHLE